MDTRGEDVFAGLEPAVVAVLVLLAGSSALVWAGAEAAAVVFGAHRPAAAGFGDAVAALPRLLADPAHPQAAWPASVASGLPGAGAYWAVTAVVAGLGVALLAAGGGRLLTRRRVRLVRGRRMGLRPEARFAEARDVAPLWVRGPARGRLVLGTGPGRRLLATESPAGLDAAVPWWLRRAAARRAGPRGSVIVLGPSQCGKTAALAIPAILEWAGPVIALSVKSDLMAATITRRRELGRVRVFDPVDVTAEDSDSWSPLRESASLSGARRAARSISNATAWTHGSGEMGFWTAAGEDLLAGLFWLAATLGLGMDTVVRWVLGMDRDTVRLLLTPLLQHHHPRVAGEAAQVTEAFDAVWRSDYRQISSVYLTARAMIQPWQEPGVAATATPTVGHAGITLDWLLDPTPATPGGAPAANTVYLCADLDDAERLAPVLGGLVDDLLKQAYARVGKTTIPLDSPLLVVIDEAGNWPLRNLPGRISTCAGLGIQLLLVFQSKAQIDAAYGTRADVVISNAVTKVFFSGLSDESTLRYAASLLGDEHVPARSTSTDQPGWLNPAAGRRGVSEAPTRVDLLPASLLRQVAPGQALLVHNTLPPAHLRGRYWFRDPHLRRLATGQAQPRRVRGTAGERR